MSLPADTIAQLKELKKAPDVLDVSVDHLLDVIQAQNARINALMDRISRLELRLLEKDESLTV